MRNPLRRAYRQLSRLIINEGFKDFAKLCGFDIEDPNCAKDSKYQAAKDAYSKIQSNDKLKKFYKLKLAKDGIDMSNLDQALYKASYDENLSRVEKFLKDYETYSASYEQYFKDETEKRRLEKSSTEYLLAKQKKKDDTLKKDFADNVVEDAEDYIVYEVRTFEEANQMRWMWMGNVLKTSNEECKKLDPNAPADSQSYGGNKTPEEMARYMMSNNKFIMNPSWCVCAGEQYWNSYNCGKTNTDGSASCHLIFSKKYPNCRFCVVRNSSKFEIRDPWQAGGFNDGKKVQYGYEVMKAVFGDDVKEIPCLHGVDEKVRTIKLATQFRSALNKDDVEVAKQILNQGIDLNYKDENGIPLIIHAVRYDAINVCSLLLDKGANIDIQGEDGKTPLHEAVYKSHTEICKLLLRYGAEVNVKRGRGLSPLQMAAEKGLTEICELLVDYNSYIDIKDNDGLSPLHRAVRHGYTEICKLLLDKGAKVDIKDKDGWTPLCWAADNGYMEMCRVLLKHRADVNTKDNDGYTPLHLAAKKDYADICELLLLYGAVVNAKDKYGRTPLHWIGWVVRDGQTETCELLLLYGADVNDKDGKGKTPLHMAARHGYTEICKLLLDHGADANLKDIDGDTPLHIAMRFKYTTTCELLRQCTTVD